MQTPFYFYDLNRLENTLISAKKEANKYNYKLHFAVKANYDYKVNQLISSYNLGADCVSGNEILFAIKNGYQPNNIVFAGVGKTDIEIKEAIRNNIACFNVESIQELEVINSISKKLDHISSIAIRVNPNVNADTHKYITTGLNENKFGIPASQLMDTLQILDGLSNLKLTGLHFHIGSQILNLENFKDLAIKVNEILHELRSNHIHIKHINLGGGLGINYQFPSIDPDFSSFFKIIYDNLKIDSRQKVHFELGRSLVGQCGQLWTKVLYLKEGIEKNFAIIDAGMTHLMRPALYGAYHHISIKNSRKPKSFDLKKYDIVGPICESTDVISKNQNLPDLRRGDILIIHSTGAYGEVMKSNYNMKPLGETMYKYREIKKGIIRENNPKTLENII